MQVRHCNTPASSISSSLKKNKAILFHVEMFWELRQYFLWNNLRCLDEWYFQNARNTILKLLQSQYVIDQSTSLNIVGTESKDFA